MDTAVIIIDCIVDISHPTGRLARSAEHARDRGTIAAVNRLLRHARERDWLRVLVKTGYADDYADLPRASPLLGGAAEAGALRLSAAGTEFHPDLERGAGDLVVLKQRISAFHGTTLDPALRAAGVERVFVAGVSTTWAVSSAVRDAHDRDYRAAVVEDACADRDQDAHAAAIAQLAGIATIASSRGP